MRGYVTTLIMLLAIALGGCRGGPGSGRQATPSKSTAAGASGDTADEAATVAKILDSSRHPWLTGGDIRDQVPLLRSLYVGEAEPLVWFAAGKPRPALQGAVEALQRAGDRGLAPTDFDAERIGALWKDLQAGKGVRGPERALFDLAVSVGLLRELAAVERGRVDPRTISFDYNLEPRPLDPAQVLRKARDENGVAKALDAGEPPFAHYARSKAALARYKALAAAGEPEPLPGFPARVRKIAPGQPWEGVPQLVARLRRIGDLTGEVPPQETAAAGMPLYTQPIAEAVKRFQTRHVMEPDGVIGADTREALNVPLSWRVRQLELSMERMRWLPDMSARPLVFVNLAIFRLWASDPVKKAEPVRMKVVVGQAVDHRTPIFLGRMQAVTFRPYWSPPYGITVKEIVPRLRRDPSYLDAGDFEIVARGDAAAPAVPLTPESLAQVVAGRLFIRQRPGPKNSLGPVVFSFPNSEDIYMHGTPAPQLFSLARRDFSHGCIRLENPARLAEWVLRDEPAWTADKIAAAMQGSRPLRVALKVPVDVVLFYSTVHVNSEDVVFFANDIYGHDRTLDEALRRGYPYPVK